MIETLAAILGADGFDSPLWLWGLLGLPAYGWWRGRTEAMAAVPHAPLQYRQPPRWRRLAARAGLGAELAILGMIVMGLARPYSEENLALIDDVGIDVVLVLDVSLSMLAEDFPPNRLEALRRIALDFIARSGGHRLGILIFAADVYVQSPLTSDLRAVEEMLDSVTVHALDQARSGGTAIGDALLVASDRLTSQKVEGRDQAVVLISDGESNQGIDPVLAARYAAESGVRLYVIGVGGEEPVQVSFEGRPVGGESPYLAALDDRQLKELAEAAGGRYDRAADVGALEAIFSELARLESAPLESRDVTTRRYGTSLLSVLMLLLLVAQLTITGQLARRPFR
ncbi:MAG: VWA domain-containing protein [Acidobacteriota bacterium]